MRFIAAFSGKLNHLITACRSEPLESNQVLISRKLSHLTAACRSEPLESNQEDTECSISAAIQEEIANPKVRQKATPE
ncbi:hypothetical protein CDAR_598861 [Caerostris darwini]|uniref:Uncharacterized protein n=1 Tax=Caerostris darwini TaxID=1538125 RepID=A0AAV4R846_9ARAC|nr:hypothetical protein CDAR_598861 [Caerostris darwini]